MFKLSVVMSTTFQGMPDAQLRLSLLRNIPATSCRLSILRRRLALSFFHEDSSFLTKRLKDLTILQDIAKQLRLPQFMIKQRTDYPKLTAMISILDVGLSDARSECFDEPFQRQRDFNREIDQLASMIKAMFTQIVDTGASHMSRTAAKDVLESLLSRLMFALRTKIKPKKDLFGNPKLANRENLEGVFLESFLSRE